MQKKLTITAGKKTKKRLWLCVCVVLGVLAITGLGLLLFPQQVLHIDSGEVQADALIVLGGGPKERPQRAVGLYLSGSAPRIILSGAGDCTNYLGVLLALGVPASAVQLEWESKSTSENAQFCTPLLRASGVKRAIIVTSWYHSRRALSCFQHYGPGIQFYSRPSHYGYAKTEWSCTGMWRFICAEYVKIPGYWIRYGVCPL